jgi:hypothetical protein
MSFVPFLEWQLSHLFTEICTEYSQYATGSIEHLQLFSPVMNRSLFKKAGFREGQLFSRRAVAPLFQGRILIECMNTKKGTGTFSGRKVGFSDRKADFLKRKGTFQCPYIL